MKWERAFSWFVRLFRGRVSGRETVLSNRFLGGLPRVLYL